MGQPPGHDHQDHGPMPGLPPQLGALQALFTTMLNPANARAGDAVYTQEALDQIISQLMEAHPTSNAPGPASPSAISSLPKKKLDEKELGPEGRGECSVCMDDVKIGDEVVVLPCNHWFHENCASLWLSEHNTCPICRKGIEGDVPAAGASRAGSNPTSRNEHRARRHSGARMFPFQNAFAGSASGSGSSIPSRLERNEARLEAIRNAERERERERERHGTSESGRRLHVVGNPSQEGERGYNQMPGAFTRTPSSTSESMSARERDDNGNFSGSGSGEGRRESRDSSSQSGSGGGGGGVGGWLRDRFSGGRRSD